MDPKHQTTGEAHSSVPARPFATWNVLLVPGLGARAAAAVHPGRHQSRELYALQPAAVCVWTEVCRSSTPAAADRDHGTAVALPWEYLTAVPWAGGRRVI
jgi:hypothetical protein